MRDRSHDELRWRPYQHAGRGGGGGGGADRESQPNPRRCGNCRGTGHNRRSCTAGSIGSTGDDEEQGFLIEDGD